jgi:hypothetical protein
MAFPLTHANSQQGRGIRALLDNEEILNEIYQQMISVLGKREELKPKRLYEEYFHGWLRLRDVFMTNKAERYAEVFFDWLASPDVFEEAVERAGEVNGDFEKQVVSAEYPETLEECAYSAAMCLVVAWFTRLENAGSVRLLDEREATRWLESRSNRLQMSLF